MIFLGILIIINIRQSRHRINVISDTGNIYQQQQHQGLRKSNHMKFIRLTLIQSLIFTIFNIGYAIYVTYDYLTSSQIKSSDRLAIEGFIYAFTIHLCYIFASFTFATYTLASSIFRKECLAMISRLYIKLSQRFRQ
ncbi:hypothetical protein I4U23_016826 [Adineta vaga]|nr:hypothetical protein I4U23_016826 [Adineta vaga]